MHIYSTTKQFIKFGLVGLSGIVVGLSIINLFMLLWHNFPLANIIAFFVAVTWNFILNRKFTFEKVEKPFPRQWGEFVISCLYGTIVNWMISMGLYYSLPFFYKHYNLAAIIGVSVGAFFNFMASKMYVFRKYSS